MSFLVPLIMIFFVVMLIMAIMSMIGVSPGMLLLLLDVSRRKRTEVEPRDHFDRWVHSHRRSAYVNKPRRLKFIMTTGDRWIPRKAIGRVWGVEPWLNFFIVFVKSRRLSWSDPVVIPQDMVADMNRRILWVHARGFSKVGPIWFPIPVEGDTYEKMIRKDGKIKRIRVPRTINAIATDVLEGFRFFMDQQLHMDITEDMHWSVATGMAPPIRERTRIAEADSPVTTEREYIGEESATGGGLT